jgi:hypothetical protein
MRRVKSDRPAMPNASIGITWAHQTESALERWPALPHVFRQRSPGRSAAYTQRRTEHL